MKMNCKQVQEYLDNLLVADSPMTREMEQHLLSCPGCQRDFSDAISTCALLKPSKTTLEPQMVKERLMNKVLEASESENARRRPALRMWKPALAAAVLAAVLLSLWTIPFGTPNYAYAIEKTLQANLALKSVHMIVTTVEDNVSNEFWARFDSAGNVKSLRMNWSQTEDGPKDVVWEGGKANIWFKAKNSAVTVVEPSIIERLKNRFDEINPKVKIANLDTSRIKVEEDGLKLTQTVRDRSAVYHIDPKTHLLVLQELYVTKDGVSKLVETTKYLDYDAVSDEMFTLNLPEGIEYVDQTTQEVGLVKGSLTDNEIAQKVAREFFEALIAKDYAKAGRLLEGTSAETIQNGLGKMNFVRIVSIGDPTPFAASQSLRVPCTLEVEVEGQVQEWSPYGPFVRQVYGQPDRWSICGGI
jgi:hypothetical protein